MQIPKRNTATRCTLLHMFFLLSNRHRVGSLSTTTTNNTKPGCQSSCGNVEIPYPFGIRPNCSMNLYFNINCNTSVNPPKPYLSYADVNLEEGPYSLEVVTISKSQIY
ncbi:unnamed protein product [Fraxinus pennsylvanica]|uniref:Wall-associated receptor kinase galacturonan-binding domain-containing protein n=1 Tax=Fraxinus pennsylvanica TaxID=56036 RepID=A0AAD1YME7_9LAMI|nr:unnamed protein product [Fraxinus pennsylvanica]